ncbi:hypothetical protein HII31_03481 [Pseudocercospora fuligena]|uniref:Uncharacterized protein n=1 Tax=Pseudocercospora fuligena TaxID=685502 RepID=A0A8H6VQK0_9PEZI|nr:hypothetical protein HII31_03481 [Pseudocercospora fuligena]
MLAAHAETRQKWLHKAILRCTPALLTSSSHPSLTIAYRRFAWGLSEDPPEKESKRWFPPPQKVVNDPKAGTKPGSVSEQEFYDWFILKSDFRMGHCPGPCAWVDRLDSEALVANLKNYPHLAKDPLRVFELPALTPGLVQTCLELFIASCHGQHATEQDSASAYLTAKPGTMSLKWLAQNSNTVDITTYPLLVRATVFCLTAEGRNDIVMQWLRIQSFSPGIQETSDSRKAINQWKEIAIRDYIEARCFWSTSGLNDGLRAFFDLDMDRNTAEPQAILKVTYAALFLQKQLWYYPSSQVHVDLFERFVSWFAGYTQDHGDRDFNAARFALVHPAKADPLPAYRFLKRYSTNTDETLFIKDLFHPADGRAASILFWFVLRTAQQLHNQNSPEKAREVLNVGVSALPQYFVYEKRKNPHAHLSKPSALRFNPSEKSLGHLDEEGYRRKETKIDSMFEQHRRTNWIRPSRRWQERD